MPRQRSVPNRDVGAVACRCLLAVVITVGATGCAAGEVAIDSPALSGSDADACAGLIDALPDSVSDQPRRPVDPRDAYGAAWGDPAIILRCGVSEPAGFDRFATCQVANGVAWFVPEPQIEDQDADVVLTTVGYAQNVELQVPARYRPPAAALIDVADAVKASVRQVEPCL